MTSGPVPVPLDDVRDAARLLDGVAYRTPVHIAYTHLTLPTPERV